MRSLFALRWHDDPDCIGLLVSDWGHHYSLVLRRLVALGGRAVPKLKQILIKMTEPFCACTEGQVRPYIEVVTPSRESHMFGLIFGCDHCRATFFHALNKPTDVRYKFDKPRPKKEIIEEFEVIFDPEDETPEDENELLRLAEKILSKK